jgi:hypothetical protein
VQRRRVAVVNGGGDPIACFELAKDVRLLDPVQHRHRRHPTLDLLTIHGESAGAGIDSLDGAVKRVRCGRIAALLRGEAGPECRREEHRTYPLGHF